MSEKTGVLLCGHGSRDAGASEEFGQVAQKLAERMPQYDVEHAFLEFATPVIRDGIEALRAKGNTHILAVPGMLFAAGHVKNDIPSVLNTYMAQHPEVRIEYGRELGIDPKMMRAAGARIQEAIDGLGEAYSPHETMLVVVGRGASDPDANANISKVMRLLWEGFGFAWGEVVYSGVTFPLVEPGLEHATRMGYKRIIVFPYFLFTGVLVNRIYEHTDIVAARHPDIEFVKASYLNHHDLVVETFRERALEILEAMPVMNCQMCKYREAVLGFEDQVGLAQESHHHHVEGIGTDDDQAAAHSHDHHDHDHDHKHGHDHEHADGHDHDHGHHHHPYPHADHPLGPVTMKKPLEAEG